MQTKVPHTIHREFKGNFKAYQQYLQRHYKCLQVVVDNPSYAPKKMSLWGKDIAFDTTAIQLPLESQPHALVYNPYNEMIYVVLQGTDTMLMVSIDGVLQQTIPLSTNRWFAPVSPVDIAVNTDDQSPYYGYVYIVGSLSNTVLVIDTDNTITREFPVGNRPLAIACNFNTGFLYTANIASADVSVINLNTQEVVSIATTIPNATIAVDTFKNEIYVSTLETQLYVYTSDATLIARFNGLPLGRKSLCFHLANNTMYASLETRNAIAILNSEIAAFQEIVIPSPPLAMCYASESEQLHIAHAHGYSSISSSGQITNNTLQSLSPSSWASTPDSTHFFSRNSSDNTLNIYPVASKDTAGISKNYKVLKTQFNHQPIIVKHIKIVSNNAVPFYLLTFKKRSITGSIEKQERSLNTYSSPQNYSAIWELFDVEGHCIDSHSSWHFTLQAKAKVTFLIYYKPLKLPVQ